MSAAQDRSSKCILNVALDLCWPRRAKCSKGTFKSGLIFMFGTQGHSSKCALNVDLD